MLRCYLANFIKLYKICNGFSTFRQISFLLFSTLSFLSYFLLLLPVPLVDFLEVETKFLCQCFHVLSAPIWIFLKLQLKNLDLIIRQSLIGLDPKETCNSISDFLVYNVVYLGRNMPKITYLGVRLLDYHL